MNRRKRDLWRYLLVAAWPASEAAIAAATVKAVRQAACGSESRTAPGWIAAARLGSAPMLLADAGDRRGRTAPLRVPRPAALPDWVPELATLGLVTGAGGVMVYEVMELLGRAVVKHGPKIDEPIRHWTDSHQVKRWTAVMERLTKVGNTWTTWGAAGTAAATLAVAWPGRKWVPPATLAAAILVDKYATLALRRRFGRPGPPGSPGGTYPCGGVDRVILFYGLIAYLLWREFSGSSQGKAWAVGAVAALSFNEAYSREYLSKHWFTDILSGVLYGTLLLAPQIAAVRLIEGPAVQPGQGRKN